jgi:hypothetical protein
MSTIQRSAIVLLALLVQAAAAMGAGDGFTPNETHPAGGWKNWVALAVFFFALGLVAFKNARRTHLD